MSLTIHDEPVPIKLDSYGVARVAGTRVSLEVILEGYKQGDSPEELALDFPTVGLANLYAVIAYYLRHQAETDAYLCEADQRAEESRSEGESRFPQDGLRDRLLERRAQSSQTQR